MKIKKLNMTTFARGILLFYGKLNNSQKTLVNLIALFLISTILKHFLSIEAMRAILVITMIYWTYAISIDAMIIHKYLYETTLGKAILLLGLTICTNFALCISGLLINQITSVSPTNFPHALILSSIAFTPAIISIVLFSLSLAAVISLPIWAWFFIYDDKLKSIIFPGYKINENNFLFKTTILLKIISLVLYGSFAYHFSSLIYIKSEGTIKKTITSFIYQFEMFDKSPCLNIPNGKVSFINDDKVLYSVNYEGNYNFLVRSCDYGDKK